jgi:hypothetical protein
MLVFSTPLVSCCSSTFSLTSLSPPPPSPSQSKRTVNTDSVWLWEGGGGVLICVLDHILQEFKHSVSDLIFFQIFYRCMR